LAGISLVFGAGLADVRVSCRAHCGSSDGEWFVEASVVFGVGQGPVDAVMVSVCGVPGEGFAAVVSAAIQISS
jgi:hypothetical protein